MIIKRHTIDIGIEILRCNCMHEHISAVKQNVIELAEIITDISIFEIQKYGKR